MRVNGERIKELRLEKGWTQQDLADETGKHLPPSRVAGKDLPSSLHVRTIINMEKGESGHRETNVRAVAKALDTTMEDLRPLTAIEEEVWEQTIVGEDGNTESIDDVLLVDLDDNVVTAKIYRKQPDTRAVYEFWGRRESGKIYGHYWITEGEGSSGVLLLREVGDNAKSYRGQYTKVTQTIQNFTTDTMEISHINLFWESTGKLDRSSQDQT